MTFFREKSFGILFCAIVAAIAMALSTIKIGDFSLGIIGAPIFAILIGMVITVIRPSFAGNRRFSEGIKFTSKKILQVAVVVLGFSLDIATVARVGGQSIPVICSTIGISLIVAYVLMKPLRLEGNVACLIGVGSSICGGSAIAATAPVIGADDRQIAQSISIIFLFNVIAALVFPYLGQALGLSPEGFAVFAGTAVNDTSSVTAAASTAEGLYGVNGILSSAVTVKLTRTLAIIPIVLVLSIYHSRKTKIQGGKQTQSFSIVKVFPRFLLWFVSASLITTIVGSVAPQAFAAVYQGSFVSAMSWVAKFFIAMAMCAVGLGTNISELVKKGGKPILLGLCCWAAITIVSLCFQMAIGMFN